MAIRVLAAESGAGGREEARILLELAHPALVRCRALGREPGLGVRYAVTELVEGEPCRDWSARGGRRRPSCGPWRAGWPRASAPRTSWAPSTRGLAAGRALLPQGRLDRAKVTDFVLARDVDATDRTLVGGPDAAVLAYAAPEQLGAFGGRIGPWTDVYGLGLALLALATGRAPDPGGSLAEAVDHQAP